VTPPWKPALSDALPVSQARAALATPSAGLDVAAYLAAIGLAAVTAWFSIRGMVVRFPGAPLSVVAMAAAMEAAKLVTAGWFARRWCMTAWTWRFIIVALVCGLASARSHFAMIAIAPAAVPRAVSALRGSEAYP
jgi:hypothetical protein